MAKDLRIEFKVKNANLYRALVAYSEEHMVPKWQDRLNLAEISRYIGVNHQSLYGYLGLTISPYARVGSRSKVPKYRLATQAEKLQRELDQPAEYLFPPHLYCEKFRRIHAIEVDSIQLISLAEARQQHLLPPPESYEMEEPKDYGALFKMLKTLTAREEQVIIERFGLDGKGERSLRETAKLHGVSTERLRQIENRAFHKLRHPSRLKKIREVID